MKPPRAILFDNDGVLIASEALHWKAWEQLLQDLGIGHDPAEVRGAIGKTAPQILTGLLDRHRPGWSPEQYDIEALARKKNDYYLEIARTELFAYAGVPEGLAWLKSQGIRLAVVSNAKRRELEAALTRLKLYPYFDAVVSRDDIQPPKPDPTPYLFAAASVGIEPEQCLAVEDSPPGLEAALMAKIPVVAVGTNFPESVLMAPVPGRPDLKPVWLAKSMEEFFSRLHALFKTGPSSP